MNRSVRVSLGLWLGLVAMPAAVYGHNLNFGTLTVHQSATDAYHLQVLFQMSGDQGSHHGSTVQPPGDCVVISQLVEQKDETRLRSRQSLQCKEPGLQSKQFQLSGLPPGATVLVRAMLDGVQLEEQLLTGNVSSWEIGANAAQDSNVFVDYAWLGVEHILIGWDHLLFLVMLILLVPFGWKLVQVITAFTLGHSVTLALATLDIIKVPMPPTEALIALSIVFLASEVIRFQRDRIATLTVSCPGIVAALFGLFHGLGFASILTQTGVAQDQLFYSLVAFNLGVEAGQLLFVATLLMIGRLARRLMGSGNDPLPYQRLTAYLGGSLGAFWLIERVAGF